MKVRWTRLFAASSSVTLSLLFAAGCGKAGDKAAPVGTPQPAFETVRTTVLEPKCVACHQQATSENHHIALAGYDVIARNDRVPPLVVPGKPEDSSLYATIKAGTMPKGGAKLSDAEIKLVYDWIKDGAKGPGGTPFPTSGVPGPGTGEDGPCDQAPWDNEPGYRACT